MNRYIRQDQLADLGSEGRRRLTSARVLTVGCGALGSVAAAYLAGAGVGTIILADFDTVDITNLQRQPYFTEADLGASKVLTLAHRLRALNSEIKVEAREGLLREPVLRALIDVGLDAVVEASDNPATKYMVTDVCAERRVPCVIGGVDGWRGQVMTWLPDAPRYRDVFPDGAEAPFTPCGIGGVFGPVPGVVGAIQASETIKVLTGTGETLAGRLLALDLRTMRFQEIKL